MDWSSLCLFAEYRSNTLFFFWGGNPSATMWVPMADFYHSLVCFEWSLQAKIQRQTGVGGCYKQFLSKCG